MILAFHKPYGVLCQFTPDQPGQHTLAEFGFPAGVYPLGRLDMDSEGLLLLSNEPGLNNRLLDPAMAHPRTYWVQVEGVPDEQSIDRLACGGLVIQGHRTLPCRVRLLHAAPAIAPREPPVRFRKHIPTSWVEMELTEGKNRQVRRMTAAVGHPTLRLIRVAIGDFHAPELVQGQWHELSTAEMTQVMAGSARTRGGR